MVNHDSIFGLSLLLPRFVGLLEIKLRKINTSLLRIKDTDLDEGTAFPFNIPSWDSHGVKLHLVFAIDLHSGVKFRGQVN